MLKLDNAVFDCVVFCAIEFVVMICNYINFQMFKIVFLYCRCQMKCPFIFSVKSKCILHRIVRL